MLYFIILSDAGARRAPQAWSYYFMYRLYFFLSIYYLFIYSLFIIFMYLFFL